MPKPFKEQLILNVNINKGGYNLRKKFQIYQSLRINNHFGEATFVYIYSKFIDAISLLFNNLKFHFIKLTEIFPKFDLWLKTIIRAFFFSFFCFVYVTYS